MYDTILSWFKNAETKNITCKKCGRISFYQDRIDNFHVCTECGTHNKYPIDIRINDLFDKDTFVEYNADLKPIDFLTFKDSKKYSDRIKENIKKTKQNSAVITGYGKINNITTNFAILNFDFMGGSLGSIEGKKITDAIEFALKYETPMVIVSSSGGARMQESSISLMQMAKTSAALKKLSNKKLPYISLLTNPTMGGVSASFAFLGDLIIAEPEAIIGFAGQRVIKQTIQTDLPKGFQTAEYLLEHGLIDDIISRDKQKDYITRVFNMFLGDKTDIKDNNSLEDIVQDVTDIKIK